MSLISHYRDIYQMGYVTDDLERAMDFLRDTMGAGEFACREPDLTVRWRGSDERLAMRVAVANVGRMQLEVIEPVAGAAAEIYRDGIDLGASPVVFHHVGIAIHGGIDNWARLSAEVEDAGSEFALSFAFDHEAVPTVRFAYADTRAWLGHYTEYLWWAQGMAEANATLPNLSE